MRALHESTTGGAAQVVLSAQGGVTYIIHSVAASYSGLPAGSGQLTIVDDSGELFDLDIREAQPNALASQVIAEIGSAVTITLSAIALIKAKLVVEYSEA